MESRAQTQPWVGVINQADFSVAAPTDGIEAFGKTPLAEVGFGAFHPAFFELFGANTFDMGEVDTDSHKQTVIVIGAARKSPFLRASFEIVSLRLPDVALRHGTAVILSLFILVKTDDPSSPSRIDVVREAVLQLVG